MMPIQIIRFVKRSRLIASLPSLALSILAYLIAFTISGHAQTVTNLYSFTGTASGNPAGALVQGRDGSFYGTTHSAFNNDKCYKGNIHSEVIQE